jgi:DNA-binding MarR family transcriptional regulator
MRFERVQERASSGDDRAIPPGEGGSDLAQLTRRYLRARRAREKLFDSDLFADPVWDILLDLYASRLEGRRVCISDACIASNVPPTTALRWLAKMEKSDLVVRHHDLSDGRRAYIELSDSAAAAVRIWLTNFFAVHERDRSTGHDKA